MPAKPIFTNEEIADALRAAHGLLVTTAQILAYEQRQAWRR